MSVLQKEYFPPSVHLPNLWMWEGDSTLQNSKGFTNHQVKKRSETEMKQWNTFCSAADS